MKSTPLELIDKHLRNELTESEQNSFDAELSSNPEFARQVEFDKLLSEGITAVRKTELKSRLDAISVSPSWYGIGQFGNSTILKSLGYVLGAAIVGLSAYMIFDEQPEVEIRNEDRGIQISSSAYDYPRNVELFELEIPEQIIEVTNSVVVKDQSSTEEKLALVEIEEELREVTGEEEEITDESEFIPNVVVPGLNELDDEAGLTIEEAKLPDMTSEDVAFESSSNLDVEADFSRGKGIRYSYFDGKLYLQGDFKSNPYEILEIHGAASKKLFLYHNNSYYNLSISDKLKELTPISDQLQINELEIVRNNKR
ncbi:MAG: hypothetical protein JXR10_08260 [Cyclobacteriaceae bacterium]